jgi:lipoprotein signal peptidase
MPTAPWALHPRSPLWAALCLLILLGLVAVLRIPARLVPQASGLLAAGVAGNALSAVFNGFDVPNPLVFEGDTTLVAYNLADIWAVLGIASLMTVLAVWMIRNRHLFEARTWLGHRKADPMAEDGESVF